ncbi:MAG: 16S rRNA (guanine(527)-N(7))-methyltransferase RsmG [Smithella sp.]|jgi:16S rRNA (guanine527-N7)-methyltransferase
MNQEMLILKDNARYLGLVLNEIQLAQFDTYRNELLQWNEKTNLISENSSQEIISRHFLDSLTAWQFIQKPNARMIDVGCGAGFPGIPLKIALPSLELYLLESNRKKVSFLKHIIRLLNISTAHVLHDRAENIIQTDSWKEKFDIVISRATFKLDRLLALSEFFLAPEGQLIALKGPNVSQEFKQCSLAKNPYKISQLIQHDIKAPCLEAPRKIIIGKRQMFSKKTF